MMFLANWLNEFGKVKKWPINCSMINGENVHINQSSKIAECLGQGGVAVARVMLGGWHYVLLTGIDDKYVYLFDPYYRIKSFSIDGIEMIKDAPTKMNRKIRYDILNSEGRGHYALGKIEDRECMILFNKKTKTSMDAIEYFI